MDSIKVSPGASIRADAPPNTFNSLSTELSALLLKSLGSTDKHSFFCTCTANRDGVLRALSTPDGPQLTHVLTSADDKEAGKQPMRLHKAIDTAVKAAACAQLAITAGKGPCMDLTQLMQGFTWQGLTVIHLQDMVLNRMVPEVLMQQCPHLHTLHLSSGCTLLGQGVRSSIPISRDYEGKLVLDSGVDLRKYIYRSSNNSKGIQMLGQDSSTTSTGSTRGSSRGDDGSSGTNTCEPARQHPQLRHLTLDVRSIWPEFGAACAEDIKQLNEEGERIWSEMDPIQQYIAFMQCAAGNAPEPQERLKYQKQADHVKAAVQQVTAQQVQRLEQQIARLQADEQRMRQQHPNMQLNVATSNTLSHTSFEALSTVSKDAKMADALVFDMPSVRRRVLCREQDSIQGQLESVNGQLCWLRSRIADEDAAQLRLLQVQQQVTQGVQSAQLAAVLQKHLGAQLRQQLAALPNLSSLHIKQVKGMPTDFVDTMLQLGSQLSTLQLSTPGRVAHLLSPPEPASSQQSHHATAQDRKRALILPQLLLPLCRQLTSLVKLQWDNLVDDAGMTTLLQLPSLQHVTIMSDLTSSFADKPCSWHSLTVYHSTTSFWRSTCQQLRHLPLASLRCPINMLRVVEAGMGPDWHQGARFHLIQDVEGTPADTSLAQQASSYVARCGGVSWVRTDTDGASQCEDQVVLVFHLKSTLERQPASRSLLLAVTAILPLFSGRVEQMIWDYQGVAEYILHMLAPHMGSLNLSELELCPASVSEGVTPQLLRLLQASVTHLNVMLSGSEQDWAAWLLDLCDGALQPITITLHPPTHGHGSMGDALYRAVQSGLSGNNLVTLKYSSEPGMPATCRQTSCTGPDSYSNVDAEDGRYGDGSADGFAYGPYWADDVIDNNIYDDYDHADTDDNSHDDFGDHGDADADDDNHDDSDERLGMLWHGIRHPHHTPAGEAARWVCDVYGRNIWVAGRR